MQKNTCRASMTKLSVFIILVTATYRSTVHTEGTVACPRQQWLRERVTPAVPISLNSIKASFQNAFLLFFFNNLIYLFHTRAQISLLYVKIRLTYLYMSMQLHSYCHTSTRFSHQGAIIGKYWHISWARSTKYVSRRKYQVNLLNTSGYFPFHQV